MYELDYINSAVNTLAEDIRLAKQHSIYEILAEIISVLDDITMELTVIKRENEERNR